MATVIVTFATRLDDSERTDHYRIDFLDPCIATCHLIRDSSLSITEEISTAVVPASSITKIKRNQASTDEEGSHQMRRNNRSLEERIYDIETRLNNFEALMMREKARNEGLPV